MFDFFDWLDKQTYSLGRPANKPKKENIKKYSDGTKYAKLATIKAFLKNVIRTQQQSRVSRRALGNCLKIC